MNKNQMYTILAGLFIGSLLISNVLAFKLIAVGNFTLPAAVIVFPIVYIVNDVLAEIYGFKNARRVILLGFAVNLMAVIMYNIAIVLNSPVWFVGSEEFALVLSSTFRILIASFIAYLIGTTMNSYVMVKMKGSKKTGNGLLQRAMVSTFIGETIDAFIFITIAFIGVMPLKDLFIMILAQAIFKSLYELLAYPVTKVVVAKIDELPIGGTVIT